VLVFDLAPVVILAGVIGCSLAGVVKGLSGLGIQAVCVPIIALAAPLETAVPLSIASALGTSLWQGLFGGFLRKILLRTWSFLLACAAMIFVGVAVLASVNQATVGVVLGFVLVCYTLYTLRRPNLPSIAAQETWLSPTLGAATGLIGGATGVFVMPAGPYFQLLRLSRDEIVQAGSFASIVVQPTLALALGGNSLLSGSLAAVSLALLGPTFLGLWLGTRLRRSLSETQFRKWFLWVLFFLGAALVIRNSIG